MSDVARKILTELAAREPERKVEPQVSEGLAVQSDPRLLRVMLENLLGNAWKFTSKQPVAKVVVGKEQRGEETVYFVRDYGAGFDMEYAKMLFTPFHRLS